MNLIPSVYRKIIISFQNKTFTDITFLILIVLLSRILFVFNLGFYSDDWSFLEMFFFGDQNFLQNYRPVYLFNWYLMYSFFGFSTAGYHIINTLVFFLTAILLYISLKKLKFPRIFVLTIPLLFILLPHYSTIHFWICVIQINLCLSLFLISLYFDLKALEADLPKLLLWKLISMVAIIANVLTYELFLPFFYLSLIITFYYYRQLKINNPELVGKGKIVNVKKLVALLFTNFLFLKIALIYKLFFTVTSFRMMGSEVSFTEHLYYLFLNAIRLDYNEYDYGFNIIQSLKTAFVEYGIQLPEKLITIYNYYPDIHIFIIGIILALIIFIYLYKAVSIYNLKIFSFKTIGKMLLAGLILFFVGYSIFFTNYSIAFTPTGIANRVSIGASLGVAIILISLTTGICLLIKHDKLRNIFFSLAVTGLCVSGFIINNTISSFWVEAGQAENEILEEIKNEFPSLPDSTRFMLDGVCPYFGPAIVFESSWDLAGAMRIAYSRKDLRADVISPNLTVTEEGFTTSLYEVDYFYQYDILIYNYNEKKTFLISSMEDAIKYFESVDSNYNGNCPYGQEAHGVKIFW